MDLDKFKVSHQVGQQVSQNVSFQSQQGQIRQMNQVGGQQKGVVIQQGQYHSSQAQHISQQQGQHIPQQQGQHISQQQGQHISQQQGFSQNIQSSQVGQSYISGNRQVLSPTRDRVNSSYTNIVVTQGTNNKQQQQQQQTTQGYLQSRTQYPQQQQQQQQQQSSYQQYSSTQYMSPQKKVSGVVNLNNRVVSPQRQRVSTLPTEQVLSPKKEVHQTLLSSHHNVSSTKNLLVSQQNITSQQNLVSSQQHVVSSQSNLVSSQQHVVSQQQYRQQQNQVVSREVSPSRRVVQGGQQQSTVNNQILMYQQRIQKLEGMLIQQEDMMKMEGRVEQLLEDNNNLQENINDLIEENKRLVELVDEGKLKQDRIEALEKDVVGLGVEIERLHLCIEHSSQDLKAAENIELEQQKTLDQLNTICLQQEQKLQEYSEHKASLQAEVQQLGQELELKTTQLHEGQEQHHYQLQEMQERVQGLQGEVQEHLTTIGLKEEALQEMEVLRQKGERQDQEVLRLEDTLRGYENRIVMQSQEVERLHMIKDSLDQDIHEYHSKVNNLESQCNDYSYNNSALQSQVRDIQQQLHHYHQQVTTLQSQYDDERGRVGVLESELRSAEGQWEAKNQENQKLEEQLKMLSYEEQRQKIEIENLGKEVETLEKEVEEHREKGYDNVALQGTIDSQLVNMVLLMAEVESLRLAQIETQQNHKDALTRVTSHHHQVSTGGTVVNQLGQVAQRDSLIQPSYTHSHSQSIKQHSTHQEFKRGSTLQSASLQRASIHPTISTHNNIQQTNTNIQQTTNNNIQQTTTNNIQQTTKVSTSNMQTNKMQSMSTSSHVGGMSQQVSQQVSHQTGGVSQQISGMSQQIGGVSQQISHQTGGSVQGSRMSVQVSTGANRNLSPGAQFRQPQISPQNQYIGRQSFRPPATNYQRHQ